MDADDDGDDAVEGEETVDDAVEGEETVDDTSDGGDPEDDGFRAILFDMDGVLVDSERYWHRFEEEWVFTEAARGTPSREDVTGRNYRETYDTLTERYGTTVSKEEYIRRYDERAVAVYGEEVELLNGARDLFAALRGRVDLAIVSSAPRAWIGVVRERFGLDPLDLVLSADDIDNPGKPEPHIYERAAELLGHAPSECVVVEDSFNGVLAATRAGAYTVGYRSELNPDTDFSATDEVAEGPEELRAVLSRLFGIDSAT